MPRFLITCVGTAPLLMHSGRLIDPLDTVAKQIKAASGKRNKTDDDHAELAQLEWLGGLYYMTEIGPFIPALNLQKSLIEGARLTRDGKRVERGVLIETVFIPLEYDGPREPNEMYHDKRFVHRTPGQGHDLAHHAHQATISGMAATGVRATRSRSHRSCRPAPGCGPGRRHDRSGRWPPDLRPVHLHRAGRPVTRRPVTRRPGGELPRWRVLYDAMTRLAGGETLTYTRMGQLLDLDSADRREKAVIAQAARRAAHELRGRDRRIATVVHGQGYQLAGTEQVLALAQRHQTRAVAEVEAGAGAVDTIDLSTLDPITARLVQATAIGFARQAAVMRTMDVRQRRLETTMAALENTTTHTAHRVEETATRIDQNEKELRELRDRLVELESTRPRPETHTINLSTPFSS